MSEHDYAVHEFAGRERRIGQNNNRRCSCCAHIYVCSNHIPRKKRRQGRTSFSTKGHDLCNRCYRATLNSIYNTRKAA